MCRHASGPACHTCGYTYLVGTCNTRHMFRNRILGTGAALLELCSAAVWATTLLGCNPADEVSSLQSNGSTPQTTFSYQRHSHLQCLRITVHPAAASRQPSVPHIFAAASPVRRTPLDEPSCSVVSISLLWCSARWHSNSLAQPVTRDARSQNRSAGQIGDCAIRLTCSQD